MGCSDVGGISTVVLNYYKYINRDEIHFDIALKTEGIGRNSKEIISLGAKVYFLPLKSKNPVKFAKELAKILKNEKYDIVHDHEGVTSFFALSIAKYYKIPVRIAHTHSAARPISLRGKCKRLVGTLLDDIVCTKFFACGYKAGCETFGMKIANSSKIELLPNAIDINRFKFNQIVRDQMRSMFNITDRYVVGMVGRLSPEKNHLFALNIVKKIHEYFPNIYLLIVGDGELKKTICDIIRNESMESYVEMLGVRNDISELNQAFDIAILPSLSEGFPVSAVESMASGLPIVMSDAITKELSFGEDVNYCSLNDKEKWISYIMKYAHDENRVNRDSKLEEHGLDIKKNAIILEHHYKNNLKR